MSSAGQESANKMGDHEPADRDLSNLDQLDLHLLRCLQMLVNEKHVTRAAARLGMPQPTLSGVLAKLRTLTGDPILVKDANGMAPTPVAIDLARHASTFMGEVRSTLAAQRQFDPNSTVATIRLLGSDYFAVSVFSDLIAKLRKEAPGILVQVAINGAGEVGDALERGDADLTLAYGYHALPPPAYVTKLYTVPFSCIVSASHPFIQGSLDLDQYVAAGHVIGTFSGDRIFAFERMIDEALAVRGRRRIYSAQLQSMLSTPKIVSQTDLIATIPTDLACQAAQQLPLQVFSHPIPLPAPEITVAWHLRSNRDPVHRWVRSALLETVRRGAA